MPESELKFPENFLWGSATASYQIEGGVAEGGRKPSIWDTFVHTPGNIARAETGDVTCDHYHRYAEDAALMKQVGLKHYRLSLSWSRIIPSGLADSEINQEGVDFYNSLFDELEKNGVEPMVTLYHWDLPQQLYEETGGFLSPDFHKHFVYYAETCFKLFGHRIKSWLTFNEPWCICILGYCIGAHAPGRYQKPGVEPYLVAHHLLIAHAKTYRLYDEKYKKEQKGKLAITLNNEWYEPVLLPGKDHSITKKAAKRCMELSLGWFAEPIFGSGDYPAELKEIMKNREGLKEKTVFTEEEKKELKGASDFFGINHYSTNFVYKPTTWFESIKMAAYGYSQSVAYMMSIINGSFTKAYTVLTTFAFGSHYFKDLDMAPYPFFYANKDKLSPYQCKDRGTTTMGWKIVPWGFRNLLNYIQETYDVMDGIIVTENGISVYDNIDGTSAESQSDRRIDFFQDYLAQMHAAIQDGAKVIGYYAWTFIDNFEWSFGYDKRFGFVHVDFDTQKRTVRPVGNWFGKVATTNKMKDPEA